MHSVVADFGMKRINPQTEHSSDMLNLGWKGQSKICDEVVIKFHRLACQSVRACLVVQLRKHVHCQHVPVCPWLVESSPVHSKNETLTNQCTPRTKVKDRSTPSMHSDDVTKDQSEMFA